MATEPKQRLFIYDRREMGVLFILGILVAVFAFTLGVHLGKRVGVGVSLPHAREGAPIGGVADAIPERGESMEQQKGAPAAVEETLNQELHDEVVKSGIRLKQGRQVELPGKTVSKEAGATSLEAHRPSPYVKASKSIFTLQVGSHPSEADAKKQLEKLESQGLKTTLKDAEVKGKGRWFRVYVGEYPTKVEAEKAGKQLKELKSIENFVIGRLDSAAAEGH